jgi:RNA polymerase primary sigma factor
MTSTVTDKPTHTSRRNLRIHRNPQLRERATQLLHAEIEFVHNDSFSGVDEATLQSLLQDTDGLSADRHVEQAPRDLPPHLARFCETTLLSAQAERDLFFRMNCLKYKANAIRSRISLAEIDEKVICQVEALLEAARVIRDRIVQSNMRLVMAVVKKFANQRNSFDDLMSEGLMTLMRAVEKFDYDRGFRFSTYAYRAISRNVIRLINDRQRDALRFTTSSEALVLDTPQERLVTAGQEKTRERLNGRLLQLMGGLNRRERFILRGRYALGSHRKVKTCQRLANILGISKERVRQLEHAAVAKLRAKATDMGLFDLAEVALTSP